MFTFISRVSCEAWSLLHKRQSLHIWFKVHNINVWVFLSKVSCTCTFIQLWLFQNTLLVLRSCTVTVLFLHCSCDGFKSQSEHTHRRVTGSFGSQMACESKVFMPLGVVYESQLLFNHKTEWFYQCWSRLPGRVSSELLTGVALLQWYTVHVN